MMQTVLIPSISVSVNAPLGDAYAKALSKLRSCGISPVRPHFSVYRKSVDARRRGDVRFTYTVAARFDSPTVNEEQLLSHGLSCLHHVVPTIERGSIPLAHAPVVVGTGPAGLFAALLLAEQGYAPLVLERGGSVEERRLATEKFRLTHVLDTETNIQFGVGGAGTFSDGKLITRINDSLCSYVLERFVEFGAPEEIRHLAKPHIGTDILAEIVTKIVERIESLGGKVLTHTRLLEITESGGGISAVRTSRGDIACDALILAIGHSARDTYEMLMNHSFSIEPKAFSVGMRIEHLSRDIDTAMYGDFAGHPALGHAEYSLASNTKVRGVYTFCMCPGGEVVAATSEEGGVVVNGMSEHARDGKNSNSAVVCSIFREDYGNTPRDAISFVKAIEQRAFSAGGADYATPLTTVGDFLSDRAPKSAPKRVLPTYMKGEHYRLASPDLYLPRFVTSAIRSALTDFDRKLTGFAASDAILCGAETRTSAPVRILRDNATYEAIGLRGVYPSGEGAGYAGGITSAAIDGLRCALSLMKAYAPAKGSIG